MKRGGPLKRTPLARVGRKKKSKAARRAELVRRVHWRDQTCRFNHFWIASIGRMPVEPHVCQGPLDVHEIVPRSVWPDGDLVDTNCVLLCRKAHSWLDDNRKMAEYVGLYRRSR